MYKIFNPSIAINTPVIKNLSNDVYIPFDPANTDYARFKKEINEEKAELQDADGNTMTAAEAKAFVATLP
jgi:hypothetical protein